MNWIPFFFIASAPKHLRSRTTEAMIPAMMPLPATQQAAVSAMFADQQIKREDRQVSTAQAKTQAAEAGRVEAVTDSVSVLKALVNNQTGNVIAAVKSPELLKGIRADAQLLAGLQNRVSQTAAQAAESVAVVEALSKKYNAASPGTAVKLTIAELQGAAPGLLQILQANPALLQRIT